MGGSTPVHTRTAVASANITDHQSTESFFMLIFLLPGGDSVRKQPLNRGDKFLFLFAVQLATPGSGEAGVNAFHQPVPSHEECCWPGIPAERARQLIFGAAGFAAQKYGVTDSVFLDKRAQPRRILQLLRFLERQSDDLKSAVMIFAVDFR